MVGSLSQSLAYIWGKESPINSHSRVKALYQLIENPNIDTKEIENLITKTQGVWNNFTSITNKIKLTVIILFWVKHQIFNEACEKLKNIIDKVSRVNAIVSAEIEKEVNQSSDMIESLEDEYFEVGDSSYEEVLVHENQMKKNEIAVLKVRVNSLENKKFKLDYELQKCIETIQCKEMNIPLLAEFDKKSLELFQIKNDLSKEAYVKGHTLHDSKTRKEIKEKKDAFRKALELRVIVLENDVETLRKTINENLWKMHYRDDLKDLSLEALEKKKNELLGQINQRVRLKEQLKKKEHELLSFL